MPLFLPGDLVKLGATNITTAAATSATVVIPTGYDFLQIVGFVAGYGSGGGIVALQFGTATTVETTARYRSQNVQLATATTSSTANVGSVSGASASQINLAGNAITGARCFYIDVENMSQTVHNCLWRTSDDSTSLTAHPPHYVGYGSYVATTAGQIQSVRLTNSAAVTLSVNTRFAVYGVKI